jgi:peroxiredoxin Q/BCP
MEKRIGEGDTAPEFTLVSDEGEQISLHAELDAGPVMLVFYPGAFTPVCTAQVCDYRDRWGQFEEYGLRLLGVSKDPAEKQAKWRGVNSLPFPLLSDPDGAVIDSYTGSSRLFGARGHRGNFIITSDRVVRYAYVEKLDVFRRKSDELISCLQSLRASGVL